MRAPAFYYRRPGLLSFLLLPFGIAYGAAAAWRMNRPGVRAGVPVICIGNPTLGGAGKTPTAIAVAQLLAEAGERPAFLSRGYGGTDAGPVLVDPAAQTAEQVGDEPLLLARHFPAVVARDHVAGARLAVGNGATVLVLDDGFQNPALEKDCSLLVIDAEAGIGNGDVFPAGPLRAPLATQLARAQGLVRVGSGEGSRKVEDQARMMNIPVLAGRLVPDADAAEELRGQTALAFAGIGRPEKFFESLRAAGAELAGTRSFPDHHRFTAAEARALLEAARNRNAQLVTTEKDMARMLGDAALAELRAQTKTLPVRLRFDDGRAMRRLLERALAT